MILPPRAREIRGNRRKGKGGVRGSPFGGARDGAVGFARMRMKNLKMVFRSVKRISSHYFGYWLTDDRIYPSVLPSEFIRTTIITTMLLGEMVA